MDSRFLYANRYHPPQNFQTVRTYPITLRHRKKSPAPNGAGLDTN